MKILTSERSGVCRLGISLYPEFASQEDNFAYLRRAAEHGFDVLFLALLGAKGTYEEVVERYLPYTRLAHELGFEIFCDVNPMVLKRLGVGISMFQGGIDLTFFKELGIDAMRLDLGMSDLEEAALAKNADGIKICINGAAVTDHVGALLSCGAPREALVAATTTIRTATPVCRSTTSCAVPSIGPSAACACRRSSRPTRPRRSVPGRSPRACPRSRCIEIFPSRCSSSIL